jgi:hypothetical protein
MLGMTGVVHHTQLIGWDGVSLTFCSSWSETMILPNSTS